MKNITITSKKLECKNSYIDFEYDGIEYRWYTNEDKFTKLFELSFDAAHGRTVRGNERKEVFAQLQAMLKVETNAIEFAAIAERNDDKKLKEFFLDNFLEQGIGFLTEMLECVENNDIQAYKKLTEPVLRRNTIKEYNASK